MAKSCADGSSTTTRTWSALRARMVPISSSSNTKSCTSLKTEKRSEVPARSPQLEARSQSPRIKSYRSLMTLNHSQNLIEPMQSMAREAGALLMHYFDQQVKIEYKGEADLVTVADRESEALILGRIRAQFPTHDVMGEEGTRIESGSDYKWYVDPLDGTTNFAHGFPVFCVSLCVHFRGRAAAAVIYDPTRDEMFTAELGQVAKVNGKPIRVSA